MTTNPIRDAIALVVVDYFERDLTLTPKKRSRTSRDLCDDLERGVMECLKRRGLADEAVART